jgi:hypothetical protein
MVWRGFSSALGLKMTRLAGWVGAMLLLAVVAGCTSSPAPANYYENDLHHGYPGPATADPSAT